MSIGQLTFHNARESGVQIFAIGSGVYDHLGLFGSAGSSNAVEIGSFQDTTIIVDSGGDENPAFGPFGGLGFMTNNKWISASGVRISGTPVGPFEAFIRNVNVFDPAAVGTYPDFANRASGTLMMRYQASGTSAVNTFNAILYAYDATGALTDPPPDVQVFAYEINASGQTEVATSGLWKALLGQSDGLSFVDHSAANNWLADNVHIFVAGISATPQAVGILDDWNVAFQLQFA